MALGRAAPGRVRIGLDVGAALNLVGTLVKWLALTFLLPLAFALGYGESVWPFVGAGLIAAAAGLALERVTRRVDRIGVRETFLVVALTWLVSAFFVSLPYLLSGEAQLSSPIDAYFEAMSGITTTGASVLNDIESVDRSLLVWRQFSQWLGGMGIIVLALAVLPRLRVGGRQLMQSELPGPEVETLAASIRGTARRLWLLYAALTGLAVLVLAVIGWSGADPAMNLFEAFAHALTTLPTGGFSTQARSIEAFAPATQWALIAFMLVAGVNFALTYRVLRRRFNPVRDEEFRLYVVVLGLAALALFLKLIARDVYGGEEAVREAVFQAVSIGTTTGYATADFVLWPVFATMVLVALMFVGGSAGSTAGAMKVARLLIVTRILRRELDQAVHREAVVPIRFNRVPIDERAVRDVAAFVLLYILVFVVGSALLVVVEAVSTQRVDLTWSEAISAAATTIGNVGPGLGELGPMASYDSLSAGSKGILIVLMWMGRLELIPVAVLLTRSYWRA